MKLNKAVAIPALALSAGLSLAACGGNSGSSGGSGSGPQAAACADWSQARQAAGTGNNGDSASVLADTQQALTDSTDPVLTGHLQSWVYDAAHGNLAAASSDIGAIDSYCAGPAAAPSTQAPAPADTTPAAASTTEAPAPAQTVYVPVAPAAPTAPAEPAYFTSATSVVRHFYQDINDHNYSGAWALGGSIIGGGSYSGWVAGYDTTASVSVGTFSAFGSDQVQTSLSAVQSDGTTKTYEGTYTVSGSVIVAANIVQTG